MALLLTVLLPLYSLVPMYSACCLVDKIQIQNTHVLQSVHTSFLLLTIFSLFIYILVKYRHWVKAAMYILSNLKPRPEVHNSKLFPLHFLLNREKAKEPVLQTQ